MIGLSMNLQRDGNDFCIDADLLGRLFQLDPAQLRELMRSGRITSSCERGEGEDAGRYRLSFLFRGKRVRLVVDGTGRVLQRSSIDFGQRPLPRSLRRPGPG